MIVKYKHISIEFDDFKTILSEIKSKYPLFRKQLFNELMNINEFKAYFESKYESYNDYKKYPNNCIICDSKCKGSYCSKCYKSEESKNLRVQKIKQTKLGKYGSENYNNINKHKATIKEKYNVENVSQIKAINEKIKQTKSQLNYDIIKAKIKQTNLLKYNKEWYNQINSATQNKILKWRQITDADKIKIIDKRIQTNLLKFGVEYPNRLESIKDKAKQTNLKKYGVEHPFQSQIIKDKIKQTNLERYGVEFASQSQIIKDKAIQSNIEKYGAENVMQLKEFQDKAKETCLEKYGVDNVFKLPEIKDKIKQTNLERYGVESAIQNPEIKNKILKTNLNKKFNIDDANILEFVKKEYPNYLNFNPSQAHIKNYHNYNKEFIENNFVKDGLFLGNEFAEYFGVDAKNNNKKKYRFDIKEPTKVIYQEAEINFLECFSNEYQVEIQNQVKIDSYKVDGFFIADKDFKINDIQILESDNVVLEFLGDFWHGYKNDGTLNPINKKSNAQLNAETFERFDKILQYFHSSDLKCKILYIWESEFKNLKLKAIKKY